MTKSEARRAIGRWEHEFRAKLDAGVNQHEAAAALMETQPEMVRNFLAASLDAIDPKRRERAEQKGMTLE